jgi:hypothetical protein
LTFALGNAAQDNRVAFHRNLRLAKVVIDSQARDA